jgi:hypothetical protein
MPAFIIPPVSADVAVGQHAGFFRAAQPRQDHPRVVQNARLNVDVVRLGLEIDGNRPTTAGHAADCNDLQETVTQVPRLLYSGRSDHDSS